MSNGNLLVVHVIEESCAGCGECIYACPDGALHLNRFSRTAYVLEGLCKGCGQCINACPYMALRMVRRQNHNDTSPAL